MAEQSKASVVGAVVANFAIMAAKLLAAAGGSSAMFSEAIHSGIDGVNDLLLLLGLKRAKRPADKQHPFGYGKEVYFWALLVSCSILAIGGGVTVMEGVRHVMQPKPIEKASWAYVALLCGVIFDGASLIYGWRQFRKQNRGKGFREAVQETKDPGSLMVITEDSAAVIGEFIAAAGVFANTHGFLWADGLAAVLIGLLLGATAIFLIAQTRALVVGEGVEDDISREIVKMADSDDQVVAIRAAHSMHFGPETVLVTMDVVFREDRRTGELMEAVDRMQKKIRDRFPAVKYVYIDPETEAELQSPTEAH